MSVIRLGSVFRG